jgi:hypothetical protein
MDVGGFIPCRYKYRREFGNDDYEYTFLHINALRVVY